MSKRPRVKSQQAGVPPKQKESSERSDHVRERIQQRAYELYELRGGENGRDLDDWLNAELEVKESSGR